MNKIATQEGREWENGLFGCFGDFKICLVSFLVPCYAEGKNAEALGEDCMLVGLLGCIGIPFGPIIRWRIRQQKGIKGSMIMDTLLWMFCPCCALAQESQEVGWTLDLGRKEGSAPAQTEEMNRQ